MRAEIRKIRKIVKKVEGHLMDEEGEILYNLAKNCKGKGVIVEIGSWKGKSTIWLGKGSKAGRCLKVFAVDPHTGFSQHEEIYGSVASLEEFKRNIKNAEVDNVVVPIVKTSEEAAKDFNGPVEFIFIDGAHEYELVKLDFELWFPKLVANGIMAFHDVILFPGPKKVVEKYILKSGNFKSSRLVDSVVFAQKVNQNFIKDRIKNRYIFFLVNIVELAAKLHLPGPIKTIGRKLIILIQ